MKTTKCEHTTEPYGGTCDLESIAVCSKCGKQVCFEHLHSYYSKDYDFLCHGCYVEISKAKTRAFTLVELMVVVTIITLLAGMLLPTLSRAQRASRIANCRSNQRQLLIGLAMYVGDNGVYPVPVGVENGKVELWWERCGLPKCPFSKNIIKCPEACATGGFWTQGYNQVGSWLPFHDYLPLGLMEARESSIVAPSRMMAVADGNNPTWAEFPGERHSNGTQNMGFCDGHVETLNHTRLADTNSLACLWNRDNQVHEETWR